MLFFNVSAYYIRDTKKSFKGARDVCNAMGATLAVVNDEAEHNFLGDHMTKNVEYWVGLTRTDLCTPDAGK